jgi:hypothetical protein
MARAERRIITPADDQPGGERQLKTWPARDAVAAEREAERAERAKLIEALDRIARSWESEKAEWKVALDTARREAAEMREALAEARRVAASAAAESAQAKEARENDRVLYQTDRTSWAQERRQLDLLVQRLRTEAARGWLSRLVHGAGAF